MTAPNPAATRQSAASKSVRTPRYWTQPTEVWDLSAGNRDQALTPTADTDPFVASQSSSATRADLLSTTNVYSSDGADLLDTYGPMHAVMLNDDTVVSARAHTHNVYDENAPAGGPYHLLTTTTTSAQTTDGVDHDSQATHQGYAAVQSGDPTGWSLYEPTTSTVDMGSGQPSLVTTTRYNTSGETIEKRMPSDATGSGAGSTQITYYTSGGSGTCGSHPAWAGLVCQTAPKAQPSTGPAIPTVVTTYSMWLNPATVTETSGSTTRTTTTSYDTAGRQIKESITTTPSNGAGTAVPDVTTGYDRASGLPSNTQSTNGTISTGYDSLGQPTSYTETDAQGNTITAATATYDIDGRSATINDGKGTQTYTYDSSNEHRGLPTEVDDTQAGTFTASYNADGNQESLTYPGGLTATTTRDNDGNTTGLTYAKGGNSWYSFTNIYSADDQVRASTTPASTQSYTYDSDGRLAKTNDSMDSTCTTRAYTFDADGNRTQLASTTGSPTENQTSTECDLTGATTTTQSHTYDSADRITDSGYVYDAFGRTTTVPSSNVGNSGDLTVGYYSNDMVASEQQNGATTTFTLDPTNSRVRTQTTPTNSITNHYADSSDDPAWNSATDGSWNRNIRGPDGQLAAITTNTGTVNLQITNIHGDVISTATAGATTPDAYFESTEYGAPRAGAAGEPQYAWLGAYERSTDGLAGLVLMGARLYNPNTGRFLQVDPEVGGSLNAYDYAGQDPINAVDLDGTKRHYITPKFHRHLSKGTTWFFIHRLEDAHKAITTIFVNILHVPHEFSWVVSVVLHGLGITGSHLAWKLKGNVNDNGVTIAFGLYHKHWWDPRIHRFFEVVPGHHEIDWQG